MFLALDGHTSAEFFRTLYPVDRAPALFADVPAHVECASSQGDVWSLAPSFITPRFLNRFDGRLRVLVFDHRLRRSSATHCTKVWSGPIPPNSFNDFGGVLVSAPEFTFLQMASCLDVRQLVAFGDELCGVYSFDESAERGFRTRRVPLTSTTALANYLSHAKGCRGHDAAFRALRHIVDGSASPMETRDEMQLCLPCALGGYGIPQPKMNMGVKLSAGAARLAHHSHCRIDLCWPQCHLAIEHQGEQDHMDSIRFNNDRARVNALELMGYSVFELTRSQVSDLGAFEQVALEVARKTAKRVRSANRGPTPQRVALHAILSAWSKSYGRTCPGTSR